MKRIFIEEVLMLGWECLKCDNYKIESVENVCDGTVKCAKCDIEYEIATIKRLEEEK